MRRFFERVSVLLSGLCLILLTGCAAARAHVYYQLRDLASFRSSAGVPEVQVCAREEVMAMEEVGGAGLSRQKSNFVVVTEGAADSFFSAPPMVYRRSPGALQRYWYASWSQLPEQAISELLVQRFASKGNAASATVHQSDVPVNLVSVKLLEMLHDDETPPGFSRVGVEVVVGLRPAAWRSQELSMRDAPPSVSTDRRRFFVAAPLVAESADEASRAFNCAVTQLLDQIEAWLASPSPETPNVQG